MTNVVVYSIKRNRMFRYKKTESGWEFNTDGIDTLLQFSNEKIMDDMLLFFNYGKRDTPVSSEWDVLYKDFNAYLFKIDHIPRDVIFVPRGRENINGEMELDFVNAVPLK